MSNKQKNIFFYILLIFTAVFTVNTSKNIVRFMNLQKNISNKEEELYKIMDENDELKKRLITFSDKDLEALARDKLSLAKEGETLIILPENISKDGEEQAENINTDKSTLTNWQKWLALFW